MVCTYCSGKTKVTNSRSQKRNNQVWRRRQCLECGSIITTVESPDYTSFIRVGLNGALKPFMIDLLYTEVLLALQDRQQAYMDAREITNTIVKQLMELPSHPVFEPQQISQISSEVLKRFDKRAWLRYNAEHPSLQK